MGGCSLHSLTFKIFHKFTKDYCVSMRKLHDSFTKLVFNSGRHVSCSRHSEHDQLIHTLNGYRAGYYGLSSPSLSYDL